MKGDGRTWHRPASKKVAGNVWSWSERVAQGKGIDGSAVDPRSARGAEGTEVEGGQASSSCWFPLRPLSSF